MNHKYEIKTFPEYFQLEDSEEEKLKSKIQTFHKCKSRNNF